MKISQKSLRQVGVYTVMGKDFRVYGEIGNPLFIANKIYLWLGNNIGASGTTNITQMLKHVKDENKIKSFCEDIHSPVKSWFITREGLIDILMKSKKAIPREFQQLLVNQYLNDPETDRLMTFTNKLI